jgi:hypothetical protein
VQTQPHIHHSNTGSSGTVPERSPIIFYFFIAPIHKRHKIWTVLVAADDLINIVPSLITLHQIS